MREHAAGRKADCGDGGLGNSRARGRSGAPPVGRGGGRLPSGECWPQGSVGLRSSLPFHFLEMKERQVNQEYQGRSGDIITLG